ncbi:protein FAR1-RELATED SEQUENCE 5-like [Silene latifolia]|uniref:protein FAR1-RELATED SEQUENCE 5-like n=1 Tax=Silene latifolia TaxID=37657 RepID=UPI003D77DE2B
MGERNTAQQMLALVVEAKYVHWHEIDFKSKELTHIFMAHPEAIKLFRAYPYVVLMDSTYKTNIYKNPLIEMVGVTPTGSSFLIACSMTPTESYVNYKWLLRKLDAILDVTGVVSPAVFVIDRELGLISAFEQVYPRAEHLLCRWHVNKAINAKALTSFRAESMRKHVIANEEDGWIKVINAVTEESFQRAWQCFQRKFVLYYTNEVLHFGNTATSRVESAHSLLKAWLKSKHLTLDSMWSRIHGMLESQHSKIKKELEDEMSKPRRTSRTFSLLQGNVSTKAIELMEKELTRGLGLGIGVDDRCRHVIRTTHGLPCACNLASR